MFLSVSSAKRNASITLGGALKYPAWFSSFTEPLSRSTGTVCPSALIKLVVPSGGGLSNTPGAVCVPPTPPLPSIGLPDEPLAASPACSEPGLTVRNTLLPSANVTSLVS